MLGVEELLLEEEEHLVEEEDLLPKRQLTLSKQRKKRHRQLKKFLKLKRKLQFLRNNNHLQSQKAKSMSLNLYLRSTSNKKLNKLNPSRSMRLSWMSPVSSATQSNPSVGRIEDVPASLMTMERLVAKTNMIKSWLSQYSRAEIFSLTRSLQQD